MILDEDDDPITAYKVISWVTVPHGSWLASSVFRVTQASLHGTAPNSTRVFKVLLGFNKRLCHIIPTDKMESFQQTLPTCQQTQYIAKCSWNVARNVIWRVPSFTAIASKLISLSRTLRRAGTSAMLSSPCWSNTAATSHCGLTATRYHCKDQCCPLRFPTRSRSMSASMTKWMWKCTAMAWNTASSLSLMVAHCKTSKINLRECGAGECTC